MYDELGIGQELDRALQQTPETRFVTVGSAVKAMVLKWAGLCASTTLSDASVLSE
jgi:hypothetical protein